MQTTKTKRAIERNIEIIGEAVSRMRPGKPPSPNPDPYQLLYHYRISLNHSVSISRVFKLLLK